MACLAIPIAFRIYRYYVERLGTLNNPAGLAPVAARDCKICRGLPGDGHMFQFFYLLAGTNRCGQGARISH
jgi:hypothetical protein